MQRRLLESLADGERRHSLTLAAVVYNVQRDQDGNRWVSDAQAASVLRALRRLAQDGWVVNLGRGFRNGSEGTEAAHTAYPTYWELARSLHGPLAP